MYDLFFLSINHFLCDKAFELSKETALHKNNLLLAYYY